MESLNQRGRVDDISLLTNVSGNVADCETDPPVGGAVRSGCVGDLDVMNRHLARRQYDVDGLRSQQATFDCLSAAQHVLLGKGVSMRHQGLGMRSWDHLKAAIFRCTGR